jgi:CheY-like chemotaxis protein
LTNTLFFQYKILQMKKILIVDDIATFIEKERTILNRADFQLFSATSGKEALAIHRTKEMDLIITDLDMPDMAGDRLCTTIRKDLTLKKVSVIIVSSGGKEEMARVERCAANAHVTKPIRPVQLIEKVSQLLDVPERKNYRVILKVTVQGKDRNESFFCSSRNISSSGMLIETDKILARGDRISCSFFLPNSERISADGEVVRIVQEGRAYHYGVRYIDIPPQHRSAIDGFVASRSKRD